MQLYNWNREPFLDMFLADKDTSNELVKLRYFNKKYNQKWHEGPASFNKKGTFMAYTRNNYGEMSADGVVKLQIYFCEFAKHEWQEPEPFYLNSAEYSVGHPALTRDGRIMFFSSDMPGGYGGTDLYMVTRITKKKWSKPINLGPKINTEGNEMFPFYEDKNSLLFYSSNGKNGLGGLDVYVAHVSPNGFSDVTNLGAPINTSSDDFAFIIDGKLKTGYFSSNRSGGEGGDDIYRFDYSGNFEKKKKVEPQKKDSSELRSIKDSIIQYTYNLLVINEDTYKPVRKAEVEIASNHSLTDSLGHTEAVFNITDTFQVKVTAVGYKKEEKTVSLAQSLTDTLINDTIKLKVNVNQAIVLKNIYYNFDKSDILPESKVELNKLVQFMKDNPKYQVELSSHTDCRGSYNYNIRLSQRRAESAVRYVVSQGIDKSRIEAKGYGETRPVNGCRDGVPCTEPEHRQNRRTEIFIPEFGKALDIKQTKGKF
jgi:outer membrane protein OmpA-like peptidoglycan-associated protein